MLNHSPKSRVLSSFNVNSATVALGIGGSIHFRVVDADEGTVPRDLKIALQKVDTITEYG